MLFLLVTTSMLNKTKHLTNQLRVLISVPVAVPSVPNNAFLLADSTSEIVHAKNHPVSRFPFRDHEVSISVHSGGKKGIAREQPPKSFSNMVRSTAMHLLEAWFQKGKAIREMSLVKQFSSATQIATIRPHTQHLITFCFTSSIFIEEGHFP